MLLNSFPESVKHPKFDLLDYDFYISGKCTAASCQWVMASTIEKLYVSEEELTEQLMNS